MKKGFQPVIIDLGYLISKRVEVNF